MKTNLITLAVLTVGVVWVCLHSSNVEWNGVKVAGAAIAWVSLALLVVARWQLGAAFSLRARAKMLVITGLYSRIRNPIYVFGETFLVGVSMLTEEWAFLWLAVVLVPVQIVRARMEARVLSTAFGEAYARYKAKTWF